MQTERLTINEFTLDDTAFIIELLNTPQWIRFIGDRNVHTTADATNYLLNGPMKSYREHGFGLYKVSLSATGKAIGMCGLIKRDTLEDVDIGFAFLPAYTGHGYGQEAANATLDYGFNVLAIPRIAAITDPENTHSIRLLEKSGMQLEREITLPGEETPLLLFITTKPNI